MSLIDEIKKQPLKVRQVMFVLSAISTASLIGLIGFSSVQRDMFVAMHSQEEYDRRQADQQAEGSDSFVIKGLDGLRAGIYDILNIDGKDNNSGNTGSTKTKAYLLPLSPDR